MKMTRVLLAAAVLLVLSLGTLSTVAQDRDDQSKSKNTVTGCLSKADDGSYWLTSEDGKRSQVKSDTINLADHVGHKFTATVEPAKGSSMEESKENPQKEAGESQVWNITKVDMMSTTCGGK